MDIFSVEFSVFSLKNMKGKDGFIACHRWASFWYYHVSMTFEIVFILRERIDKSLKESAEVCELFKQMKLKRVLKLRVCKPW